MKVAVASDFVLFNLITRYVKLRDQEVPIWAIQMPETSWEHLNKILHAQFESFLKLSGTDLQDAHRLFNPSHSLWGWNQGFHISRDGKLTTIRPNLAVLDGHNWELWNRSTYANLELLFRIMQTLPPSDEEKSRIFLPQLNSDNTLSGSFEILIRGPLYERLVKKETWATTRSIAAMRTCWKWFIGTPPEESFLTSAFMEIGQGGLSTRELDCTHDIFLRIPQEDMPQMGQSSSSNASLNPDYVMRFETNRRISPAHGFKMQLMNQTKPVYPHHIHILLTGFASAIQ